MELEGSFKLQCPKIDEAMIRHLSRGGGSRKPTDYVEKGWLSSQFQVLDAMRPLIKLWNSKSPNDPDVQDLEASLRLMGVAFANISKMRRANVLRQVAPRMMSLLDDPDAFSSREYERLFGTKFLDSLMKETEESDKLARLGHVGGPYVRRNGGHSTRSVGNYHSNRSGGLNRFYPYPNTNPGSRGRDGSRQRSRLQYGQQYRFRYVPSPVGPSPSGELAVGARLLNFASEWASVTSDPWVLSVISNGYRLDFVENPIQVSHPPECAMSAEMSAVCDQEVQALLLKKAIIPINQPVDGFVSSMFTIKKKKGKEDDPQLWRPIINLKRLNSFVAYEHFKMENLDLVRYIIRRGDWMAKIDLKDAYFTIPIAVEHQKFLCFVWKKEFYQYVCLPFGLCSAPRVFTKILRPVVGWLRARGIRLVIYLDDILIMAETSALLLKDLNSVTNILDRLGFLVNEKKSVFIPCQVLEFLGCIVNSVSLCFSLPLSKVNKVIQLWEKALRAEKISLRQLASIMGNFSWAIPMVPFAQAHFRNLQQFFHFESRRNGGNLDAYVFLSVTAKADLQWWFSNLQSFNGKAILPDEPDMIIYSDASLTGWGAFCEQVTTRGPWTLEDSSRHINELELLSAFYALQAFTNVSHDIAVHLYLDNSTAVSYINKCGGTRSKNLCDLAALVINWCEIREIQVTAFYLPGSMNYVADHESRSSMDASDWMLNKSMFRKIQSLWMVEIDLFANAWNAQLPTFVSWFRQPLALTTNAFSLCWRNRSGYAFPPFSLIPKCLAKIRKEKATLILVCPLWPTQPWFPLLLELAADVPRILRPQSDQLMSSIQQPHPLNESIILTAWNPGTLQR